ncbi:uncharacterized protein LOC106876558 isoform X2 [Octopus bimaculoides]|uniref:uncharacterized protein LOC106876558 isoform X2 n=1 Tax=Octopus bimaculoides TaxID=37653 RepID=UPI00071E49B6|nr:uncharacterized protein LOC106876558 isoform X2 [Octopus bimaculoides]|eukprot:XP_014780641.1 PREDICTED: uncharacterized protein LOC106876558 isoform X1 [Octopus bimaculoides]
MHLGCTSGVWCRYPLVVSRNQRGCKMLLFSFWFGLTVLQSMDTAHGYYTLPLDTANQFNGEYLDQVNNQNYHTDGTVIPKHIHKTHSSHLKLLKLKSSDFKDPTSWHNPTILDNDRNSNQAWIRPNLQSNIEQVAKTNSQQRTLHLQGNEDQIKTVGSSYKQRQPESKNPLKLFDGDWSQNKNHHSAYILSIHRNNNEIGKEILHPYRSGDSSVSTQKQNVTSKNPSAEKHKQKVDESGYIPMHDIYFIAIIAACSVAGFVGIIVAAVCWYKLQANVKASSGVDYPAYGVTGPNKERLPSPGDRKLAQSAQMYHYQHQKQQMIALEKANGEMKHDASDDESEDDNEEGDYTVYECPGLAPTGEMEVKNPLFSDESSTFPRTNSLGNGSAIHQMATVKDDD